MSDLGCDNPKYYAVEDLRYLMKCLRDPLTGCPWDLAQTFQSIAPSTLEEAYEVVDAIENGTRAHLCEELGDLLFQVIFYNQLAEEEGAFHFDQIVHGLVSKLIRRHPHVFPDGNLYRQSLNPIGALSHEAIKTQWEIIKQNERQQKGQGELFADIPMALPALSRATKIQKRAAKSNMDWPHAAPLFDVVRAELNELYAAWTEGSAVCDLEGELGDLLFSVVNLARHLQLEPEAALRRASEKFMRRFEIVSAKAMAADIALELACDELKARWWQEAKAQEQTI